MTFTSRAAVALAPAQTTAARPGVLEKRMDFDSLGEIIATRRLSYFDEKNQQRTVSVFIGKPQQMPNSPDYHCPFQVIGIGSQQTVLAYGRDSIHALQSAMLLIGANLKQLNEQLGCRLTWEGSAQGELGFPLS
jgi:hypothetical protein